MSHLRVAHVVVDIPAREIATHFDYLLGEALGDVAVGSCVLVDFGGRPAVGYVVGISDSSQHASLRPVRQLLAGPYFGETAVRLARWISREYVAPLSESVRLFTPPGGTPKARKTPDGWRLIAPDVQAVDDRWVELTTAADGFRPTPRATAQRALLDALAEGPVRVAELAADLGPVDAPLRRLEELGVVEITRRRRIRDANLRESPAPRHAHLTDGQSRALEAISASLADGGGVVLLDGVTGSGKTEVYLRGIERVRQEGGSAIVLVPEISLTPQTVGRFRARFGDDVAVLHSRLSAGERYDQWDLIRAGHARIVVGARSALFAPVLNLRLLVIDEEHESSYKQGSAPRYHARDVGAQLCGLSGATLVLGSASPSMESRARCDDGEWTRVVLPDRVEGRPLPETLVVDMTAEFEAGHRSMFSRPLIEALKTAAAAGDKAVLLLNRRGFASFLLCRECGFVPTCDSCSTSLTYHEVGAVLACHHCGARRAVPPACPECGSPYLRQFGAGTQRVEAELTALLPELPVVRMDADTTSGKGGHERALASFEAVDGAAVLLGTQMIAKGLDYPEVTLVGVINADTSLHLPDFRAAERTYQMLEQVAGRAGRGARPGRVIVQSYWPDHPAIVAAARHDPEAFYERERATRRELGYPPFGRLANVLVWGRDRKSVVDTATHLADALATSQPAGFSVLGPSPAPLERLKGTWRWHLLVKGPPYADLAGFLGPAVDDLTRPTGVAVAVDIDPSDLL